MRAAAVASIRLERTLALHAPETLFLAACSKNVNTLLVGRLRRQKNDLKRSVDLSVRLPNVSTRRGLC